ncbi:hypothetical protein GCM10009000_072660 [Halobacterium noricense]|uniref:Alcohol dehydrogenase-like C-terminal domain-containing protein n=1 Tax=Haladaptatus pallidirubidus TaxID=1008152 RepID=A0AAV3ULK5_9EURY
MVGGGGLGHIGLQALRTTSAAEIIAVEVKDEALSLAADLGANYTVNSRKEDVVKEMDAITDGDGVRQILDFVGGDETLGYAPSLLAGGGDHHVVGYGGHVHEPAQALVNGGFDYRGTLVETDPELQELMALVARGDVELRTSRYDLDEINDVADKLERGKIEDRGVITP